MPLLTKNLFDITRSFLLMTKNLFYTSENVFNTIKKFLVVLKMSLI